MYHPNFPETMKNIVSDQMLFRLHSLLLGILLTNLSPLFAQHTYYSYQSGSWAATSTWTTDPSGTLLQNEAIPGASDTVVILNGRRIYATTGRTVAALTLSEGSVLDLGTSTGHNFGIFRGSGRLRIASASFPAGLPAAFVASGGGTVEYYNTGNFQLPASQGTYNNLIINLDLSTSIAWTMTNLTINGNLKIGKGTFRISDNNMSPSSDNRLIIDVKKDIQIESQGSFTVGNSPTNTTNLPSGFGGSPPYTSGTDTMKSGYMPGALVTRYYDIYHKVYIGGNLINYGSAKFIGSSITIPNYTTLTQYGAATVRFYGTENAQLLCDGPTDFYNLIIDKGVDQTYELVVDASDPTYFRLFGRNDLIGQKGGTSSLNGTPELRKALWIKNGTLRLTGYVTIPSLSEGVDGTDTPNADFYIPTTAALIIDGANVTVLETADSYREVNVAYGLHETSNTYHVDASGAISSFSVYGKFQINDGYMSCRKSGGYIFWPLASGEFIVNGGILDAKQIRSAHTGTGIASFIMTGGTMILRGRYDQDVNGVTTLADLRTVSINYGSTSSGMLQGSRGTFNIASAANHFSMSDGNIYIYDICGSSNLAIQILSDLKNVDVTGGSFHLITSNSDNHDIYTTAPLGNLSVQRRTSSAVSYLEYPLTVLDSLNLTNTQFNASFSNYDLTIGGDFRIQSTATYNPRNNNTIFNGTGGQVFGNTGTISSGLYNLVVTNQANVLVSSNLTVRNNLQIDEHCTLNDGGRTIAVQNNILNSGIHQSSLNGSITLSGSNAQTIDGNGDGTFGNLILNKSGGSVQWNAPGSIAGTLRLAGTAGLLDIGTYRLSLESSSKVYSSLTGTDTVFSSSRMIKTSGNMSDGGILRKIGSAGSYFFPVGTAGGYMPVEMSISSVPHDSGNIILKPVNSRHPLAQGSNNALACYWKIGSEYLDSVPAGTLTYKMYYPDAAIQGNEALYVPGIYNTPAWKYINDVFEVNDPANEISFRNIRPIFGDFTAGETSAFGTVTTFYSRKSGDWDDPQTWSTDSVLKWAGPAATATPASSNQVVIGDGSSHLDTVVIRSNDRRSGSLQINEGSVLDMGSTTGHVFDVLPELKIGGTGTLRISSNTATATFPGTDFGNFLSTAGGTVEYYTSGTSFTLPVTSSSGYSLDHYNHLVLSASSSESIQLPNKNITVYKNMDIGRSSAYAGIIQFSSAASGNIEVQENLNVRFGTLRFANGTARQITVAKNTTIDNGASFTVATTGTAVSNQLYITGNLINNGNFDMDAGSGRIVRVTFNGSANNSISGTGSQTELYSLVVDKGDSPSSVLDVSSSSFSMTAADPALILNNGTFRLTSPVTATLTHTRGFTVPLTAGLSVNGGTILVSYGNRDTADLILAGKIEVLAGKLQIGDTTQNINNDIEYANAGFPEIDVSGGTLSVNGQIRRGLATTLGSLIYDQTGGTVIIRGLNQQNTRAKLEIDNSGSSFTMTGGKLIFVNGNGTTYGDVYIRPQQGSVTGGTIELDPMNSGNQVYLFDALVPLNNLTIKGKASNTATANLYVHPLVLNGALILSSSYSTLKANNLDAFIGGNFQNAGTYTPGTNHTVFDGNGSQSITLTASTTFDHFTVQSQGTVTFAGTFDPVINDTLSLISGTLNDGGKKIMANGHINVQSIHASTGSGRLSLQGTSQQIITGNDLGVLGNVELNNSKGVALKTNLTINGNLIFSSGSIYIDDYLLIFGTGSGIAGSPGKTSLIRTNGALSDAGVKKMFSSGTGDFTFPVGVTGKYTPARFQVTGTDTGSITVRPINGIIPSIQGASPEALSYYWNVTGSGLGTFTVTHTYTYDQTDVNGNESNYVAGRYYQEQWVPESGMSGTVNITGNIITLSGKNYIDGEYTAANASLLTNIPTFYSITSGNWDSPSTWSTVSHTGPAASTYPDGNPVKIAAGHTITSNGNYRKAYSVDILGVLDLGATYGHSLGHVSGSGKIIIANTPDAAFVFPGGEFESFMNTTGSTIEYQGAGILPVIKTYQNIRFTGTGTKEVPDVRVLVKGNLDIISGVLDNSGYDQTLLVHGNWTDQVSSGFVPGTGLVSFEGTGAQTIQTTGTEQFYNFRINNPAGAMLSGAADVSHFLYLTQGNITTSGSVLTLTNTLPTVVKGGGSSSYINGPLLKNILSNSYFTFPTGKSGRYGEVGVLNTNTSATATWEAEYYNQNPHPTYDTSQVQLPLQSVSGNEYWRIKGPSGDKANVKLRWDSQSGIIPPTAADRQKLRVAEWMPGWQKVGGKVTDYGISSGTVETTTPVSLDEHIFTLGIEKLPTVKITSGDVSICNDGSEASVVVALTGTAPWTFTYQINGGANITVSNIATTPYSILADGASLGGPGIYAFRLTSVYDATGSYGYKDFTTTATVTVKQTPVIVISGKTSVAQNETGVVYSTPGTSGDNYTWSVTGGSITSGNGTKQITVTWGSPGTGIVRLTETNPTTGCTDYDSTNITINLVPNPAITGSSSLCAGTTAGYSTAPGTGHTFRWGVIGGTLLSGQGTVNITVSWTAATNGKVFVRDSIPATGYYGDDTLDVTVHTIPLSSCTVLGDTICSGGTALIRIVNSEAGIRYQLREDADSTPIGDPVTGTGLQISLPDNPAATKTYNILATNEYYCNVQLNTKPVVLVNVPPSATLSVDPETSCSGSPVTATAGGGNYYTFLVNNAAVQNGTQNTYTSTSLVNNDHISTIALNTITGCSDTASPVTVTVNPKPTAGLIASANPVCAGQTVTLTASGGTAYDFLVNGTSVQSGTSSTYLTSTLQNNDSVKVIVSNASGCQDTSGVIVFTVHSVPVASLLVSPNPSCSGETVTLTGSGGDQYAFYKNGSVIQSGTTTTYSSPGFANGDLVSLIVTNTAGGCSDTASPVTVTVNPKPTAGLIASVNPVCAGQTVTLTASGGTSYDFLVNGTSVQFGASNTYTTSTLQDNDAVKVIVGNASGCQDTSGVIVFTVHSVPVASLLVSPNPSCSGETVTLTGSGGDQYAFYKNGSVIQSGTTTTYSSPGFANGDLVSLIVTNTAGGCSDTASPVTVTVNPKPTAGLIASVNPVCAGQTVTLTASGGTSYDFLVNGTSVQFGASNTYTTSTLQDNDAVKVIVGNASGCQDTSGVIVFTVHSVPVASLLVSKNPSCSGESITFTSSGGDHYRYLVNGSTVQDGSNTDYISSALANGDEITSIVTTATSTCADTASITVTILPSPVAVLSVNNPVICEGDTVTFTASGGTDYQFFVNGTGVQGPGIQNQWIIASLTDGDIVTAEVTGSNGCKASSSGISITVHDAPDKPTITPSGDISITEGDSILLQSSPGYQYAWSPDGEISSGIEVKTSGSYSVQVTNASGCRSPWSDPTMVTVNPFLLKPTINLSGPTEFCEGNNVILTGPEGYSYSWSNGEATQSITISTTIIVTLQISDNLGHTSTPSDPVNIVVHPLPSLSLLNKQDVACNDGTTGMISVSASGGSSPYQYTWSGGLSGSQIENLSAGTYKVTLQDLYQCTDTLTVTLSQPSAIVTEETITQPYCSDISDGAISLSVSGGTDPYTVNWSNGNEGLIITGLSEGIYSYTVTDGNGCTVQKTVTLNPENEECIVIPTIITPNNDGYNDTWEIQGIENYPEAAVEVYDRWGRRVFFSRGYPKAWDGKYKGEELPMDSYHFVIRLKSNRKPIIGNITIVR